MVIIIQLCEDDGATGTPEERGIRPSTTSLGVMHMLSLIGIHTLKRLTEIFRPKAGWPGLTEWLLVAGGYFRVEG